MTDSAPFYPTLNAPGGLPVYQAVIRAEWGTLVSLFDEDMVQITTWKPLARDLFATWESGPDILRSGMVAWVMMMRDGQLRLVPAPYPATVVPGYRIHVDMSKVDKVRGTLG